MFRILVAVLVMAAPCYAQSASSMDQAVQTFLSTTSLEKMTTPFMGNYAFGLAVHPANGHTVFDHGGGIEGFNTFLAYYPDSKITIVVLANLNGPASDAIAGKLGVLAHENK